MADEWIKMRKDLGEDPAVIRIAAKLDISEYAVVGMLHKFWAWADSQTENGNVPGVTENWIDRYIGVTGFANLLAEGDGKKPWLEILEDGICIPNYERHLGQSAKKRALTKNRVSVHRKRKNTKNRNAPSVTKALPEKRREEKNKTPVPNEEREPVLGHTSETERQQLLSLSEDTFVNRWLKTYQHHRPGAGHPFKDLNTSGMADARMRIEDLEREFGEDRAMELLAVACKDNRRPTSPKQAVLYCQQKAEAEAKRKESSNGRTDKPLRSQKIIQWHPEKDAAKQPPGK